MSKARGMEISEQEMRGARKMISNEESYNSYGGDARKVEIKALEARCLY